MTATPDTGSRTVGLIGRWTRRTLVAVSALVVVVVFPAVTSTFLPTPLNVVGAVLSSFSAHLLVGTLLLTAATVWMWWRRRTWGRRLVAGLAVLSLVGVAVVAGRQLALAAREGVNVDAAALFDLPTGPGLPDEDVTYLSYAGQDLVLSVWRPARGGDTPAPVVVMVHGGGWIQGSRLQNSTAGHARWFAEQGYLVVSADYTLSTPQRHLWDVTEGQIGCALAWTAANAARYGGDPERLAMTGDSAGGNLALEVSYKGNSGALTSSCGGDLPKVRAVSALYPATDMAELYANDLSRTFTEQYIGGSPQQYPERYAALTPAGNIGPQTPPTMLTTGTSDALVPPDGTYRLDDRLRSRGVPSKLVRVPFGQHVFDAAPGAIGTQVWRQATLRWFGSHGA